MKIEIPKRIIELINNINYWELRKIHTDRAVAIQSCFVVMHFAIKNGGMINHNNPNLERATKVLISEGILSEPKQIE